MYVVVLNSGYWEEMLENVKKNPKKSTIPHPNKKKTHPKQQQQQPPPPTTQTNQSDTPKLNKNPSLLEVDFE